MSQKKCSKCEVDFSCFILRSATEKDGNEKPGCWCEELHLDMQTLKAIKSQFDNCLCPVCLKEYSLKEVKNWCSLSDF